MHQLHIEGGYKLNKSKLTLVQKSDSVLSCANLSSRLVMCCYQDNLSSRTVLFNLFCYSAPLKIFWRTHAPYLL